MVNLKAAGATRINSRVNGEQRPNGIIDFMQFYDMLPTPNACDYNTTWSEEAKQTCLERRAAEGKTSFPSKFNSLRQMAREERLPTPVVMEIIPEDKQNWLLTPSATDGLRGQMSCNSLMRHRNKTQEELANASLATQVASFVKKKIEVGSLETTDGDSSRLSPLFTEEMMGFPLMWTAYPFLSENGEPKA